MVGTWVGATTDDDDPTMVGVQTIVFNQDGTGSISESFILSTQTSEVLLTWSSDATTIYGSLEGQGDDEIGYVLSQENNMLQLTFPEGDSVEYARLQ